MTRAVTRERVQRRRWRQRGGSRITLAGLVAAAAAIGGCMVQTGPDLPEPVPGTILVCEVRAVGVPSGRVETATVDVCQPIGADDLDYEPYCDALLEERFPDELASCVSVCAAPEFPRPCVAYE